MNYNVVILKRNISGNTPQAKESTRRHLVRRFKVAYSRTGLIFNDLNFEDLRVTEDNQGNINSITINVNQKNSISLPNLSDPEEVLNTKVFLWNSFADAIINLF